MCAIVLLSLIGTAYLAVVFNRRAKADLSRALEPLASVISGTADVEEAVVHGRFAGQIAEGRMATSFMGPGRVFHTSIIDGAGGDKWVWTVSRGKLAKDPPHAEFESGHPNLEAALSPLLQSTMLDLTSGAPWSVVEYDPAPGHIMLTRPMQSRKDIPSTLAFDRQLQALIEIAQVNRSLQQPGA
jgi:hypothetical protein